MAIRFDFRLMETDAAERGWDRSTLADKAKVSRQTVSKLFIGSPRPSPRIVKKLAGALGRPVKRYIVTEQQAVAS
jgi:transcriptional regulator with XRE-family HTH domain